MRLALVATGLFIIMGIGIGCTIDGGGPDAVPGADGAIGPDAGSGDVGQGNDGGDAQLPTGDPFEPEALVRDPMTACPAASFRAPRCGF